MSWQCRTVSPLCTPARRLPALQRRWKNLRSPGKQIRPSGRIPPDSRGSFAVRRRDAAEQKLDRQCRAGHAACRHQGRGDGLAATRSAIGGAPRRVTRLPDPEQSGLARLHPLSAKHHRWRSRLRTRRANRNSSPIRHVRSQGDSRCWRPLYPTSRATPAPPRVPPDSHLAPAPRIVAGFPASSAISAPSLPSRSARPTRIASNGLATNPPWPTCCAAVAWTSPRRRPSGGWAG